jgi:hypothetical protein
MPSSKQRREAHARGDRRRHCISRGSERICSYSEQPGGTGGLPISCRRFFQHSLLSQTALGLRTSVVHVCKWAGHIAISCHLKTPQVPMRVPIPICMSRVVVNLNCSCMLQNSSVLCTGLPPTHELQACRCKPERIGRRDDHIHSRTDHGNQRSREHERRARMAACHARARLW